MVKENTVNNQPSPSGLTSMDTPSHISIDPLDFVSLRNFQIYGVLITGNYIRD